MDYNPHQPMGFLSKKDKQSKKKNTYGSVGAISKLRNLIPKIPLDTLRRRGEKILGSLTAERKTLGDPRGG